MKCTHCNQKQVTLVRAGLRWAYEAITSLAFASTVWLIAILPSGGKLTPVWDGLLVFCFYGFCALAAFESLMLILTVGLIVLTAATDGWAAVRRPI